MDNEAAVPEEAEIVRLVCSSASKSFWIDRPSEGSFGSRGVLVFLVNSVQKCFRRSESRVCPPMGCVVLEMGRMSPARRERRVSVVDECPTSMISCVRSCGRGLEGDHVGERVVRAAAPASSSSCKTGTEASLAAWRRAER